MTGTTPMEMNVHQDDGSEARAADDAPPLRIAILGAGAMGSFFGAALSRGGTSVFLVDVDPRQIEAISARGLSLCVGGVTTIADIRIGRPDDCDGPLDCILVFTKAYHTRTALASVEHLIDGDVHLMTLQNGLGNVELLSEFVPAARVVVGVTTYPAVLVEPGVVQSAGQGVIDFASQDGTTAPIVSRLLAAFTRAGLVARVDGDVMLKVWRKVAFNAALNTICALTRRTVGEAGRDAEIRALAHRIARETLSVGRVELPGLGPEDAAAAIDNALDTHLTHRPSMLQDIESGRRTEIDSICGAVVARARRHGVAVPALDTVHRLVRLADGA